jgi:monovalent cation:H+ antiporter-2, CPA2 family
VGIERKGARLLNPESTIDLKAHDILWVVGNKKKILTYIKETIG